MIPLNSGNRCFLRLLVAKHLYDAPKTIEMGGGPEVLQCANRLLRYVMAYYLDGKALKSRKVLKDIKEIEKNN